VSDAPYWKKTSLNFGLRRPALGGFRRGPLCPISCNALLRLEILAFGSAVSCSENPRVGGSIPSLATIDFKGLHGFSPCKPFSFVQFLCNRAWKDDFSASSFDLQSTFKLVHSCLNVLPVLMGIALHHSERLMAGNPLHSRKIDPGLHKMRNRCMA
jgi:hypothetical protein